MRSVVRWVSRSVLLGFGLAVAAAIVIVVVLPRLTQGAALTVLTGSMAPEVPVGSVVVVVPADPRTLEVGDIATYQAEPGEPVFITHRVVAVEQGRHGLTFTFQGDANRGPDLAPVPSEAVRGKVWFHIPFLGTVRDAVHGRDGITLVAMILLGGYAVTQLAGGIRDRRRRRDVEEAQERVLVGPHAQD